MEYYILSRRGSREINEDFADAVVTEKGFSFILADGLGGHDRGEVASALVTATGLSIYREMCEESRMDLERYLTRCFVEGQDRLLREQQLKNSEMRTTMVVLASDGEWIQWGHIGDSRLYQFRNGKLVKRTLDHSVVQMLVRTGEIREQDIRGHEDRNRLLRVMGAEWGSSGYELAEAEPVGENQAYLLCSDGFWELIEEKQMERDLKRSESPREWLEFMEKEILEHGYGKEMDNYTAIGVFAGRRKKQKGFLRWFT